MKPSSEGKTAMAWALEVQMASRSSLSNGEFERLAKWIEKGNLEERARALMATGHEAVTFAIADPDYEIP